MKDSAPPIRSARYGHLKKKLPLRKATTKTTTKTRAAAAAALVERAHSLRAAQPSSI